MSSRLATRPEWKTVAKKLHSRIWRMWSKRYEKPTTMCRLLNDMRTTEMFKDLGHDSWTAYTNQLWGRAATLVRKWEYCHGLVQRFPDVFKLCPVGVVAVQRIADMTPFVHSREDIWRWRNLALMTSRTEWEHVIEASRQAKRCGLPTHTSVLLVAFVDSNDYETYVRPALTKGARNFKEPGVPLGRTLAWICARALGKSPPGSLGLDGHLPRRPADDQFPPLLIGGTAGDET